MSGTYIGRNKSILPFIKKEEFFISLYYNLPPKAFLLHV